ncbi:MAG TPA: SH3 domain-containing protein [Chloroflexota bacterium]|nr:SH3 domain-containing protein [Chloroflexota bacterium]
MVLARSLLWGLGAALVLLAFLRCSVPAALSPSPGPSLTRAAAATIVPAPATADPSGPDGAVERAYQAFARGDGATFLDAIDPAVRAGPGPLEFGNLVVVSTTGLDSDLSKTIFSKMRYSVLSIAGEWAEVGVQGVARSVALGKEVPLAGVEVTRRVQDRWVLSTAQARTAAQAERTLEAARDQPDTGSEGRLAAATPQPGPEPPYWRIVGEDGANLREAPSQTASILRELPKAEVVTNLDQEVAAEGLTWRRVAYGTVEGWIAAALLAPQRD